MLTPVDFVRQRAAMIDQWGRGDPHLIAQTASFLVEGTGRRSAERSGDARALCEEQRNALIGTDMFLFTPELAECARQALQQLDPVQHLDLDPLPIGGVFAFSEPVRAPSHAEVTASVLLPMPGAILLDKSNPAERIRAGLFAYSLRTVLLDCARDRIAAGNDPDLHRRAEALLRERSAPWWLNGVEFVRHDSRPDTWELLLRAAVTFARSPGIAQSTRAPIPRSVARAAARFKAELPDSGVQVIDLRRRTSASSSGSDTEVAARTLGQRVIVRGHWRRQACGPNHSERRLTWIDQHLRGPEWGDVKGVHRVYFGHGPR